ncbi:YheC/YheD family protein [Paenibacillus camerounensis]|uniref:YheC/YheD family protein n=1 Tax=Paenibacillus camerounensis TaxID=1243663 RepID=UPI0005A7FD9E|nr:YheC/YheD family protein [Paenibacillus camerounensis]
MRIQRVSSKWAKTKVILQNRQLAIFIPETRKYSLDHLTELLDIYGTVYIKPDRGTYGIGVMRAERRVVHLSPSRHQSDDEASVAEDGKPDHLEQIMYVLRYGKDTEVYNSAALLDAAILPKLNGRPYLVQQGIDLLKHHDRPFDLRVLTQKTPSGGWETTGMLGRVAAPQKVVTNYHNGGSIFSVEDLFKEHMSPGEMAGMIQQLKSLGVRIGAQLETAYPGLKEIGLDVALDQHHDPWLLEVNTLPAIMVFKTFPDKSIYRKIRRYAIYYGRLKKTKPAGSTRRKLRLQ